LFIADEVMTGWGRTGTLFACEQAKVTPDIACYSKGLTGGSLPLAVTLCRADIFDAHYSTDRSRTFFHSSSYTANPIACAAALANLEIWEQEPVLERVAAISRAHAKGLDRFRDDRRFSNVRQIRSISHRARPVIWPMSGPGSITASCHATCWSGRSATRSTSCRLIAAAKANSGCFTRRWRKLRMTVCEKRAGPTRWRSDRVELRGAAGKGFHGKRLSNGDPRVAAQMRCAVAR